MGIRSNVTAIYNKVIALDEDTDLIASTLWSNIPIAEAYFVEHGVTDFRRIHNGEYNLSWNRFNEEHKRCVEFIRRSVLASKANTKIVASHHVPSFDLMAEEFRGSSINGAFTSNLNSLIIGLPIDYWIYGHSHRNIDHEIGETKCVSNQLGYVFANEHLSFKPDKVIEI